MTIQYLPLEILQNIIYKQLRQLLALPSEYQQNLASLAATSNCLHQLANAQLYQKITIYDDDNCNVISTKESTIRTYIHIKHLSTFVYNLTLDNFLKIQSIHIHCKSNFNKFEYTALYNKLLHFWNITQHCIELINFDIDNIRKNQTILQHLAKNSYEVMEENDEVVGNQFNGNKITNLLNWSILHVQELSQLATVVHPNLKTLDFFIEAILGDEDVPREQTICLPQLEQLNLNTTLSTQCFLQLKLQMPSLKKASISYSHSFNKPPLNFDDFHMINFDELTDLELKFNCLHSDCTCINNFYHALSHQHRSNNNTLQNLTRLKKLTIVNHNSKNQVSNLQQYAGLVSNQLNALFNKFSNLEYLYINLNEFIKNDQCKINWTNFSDLIQLLSQLETLIIPDFFKWWIPTIQLIRHPFINTCACLECNEIRRHFLQMAQYDEQNNFTHNFTNFQFEPQGENTNQLVNIDLVKKCNSKFLSHVFNAFQSQFHQLIIYSMSTQYFRNKYENTHEGGGANDDDDVLAQFQTLLRHNHLKKLAEELKGEHNNLTVNCGGVLI